MQFVRILHQRLAGHCLAPTVFVGVFVGIDQAGNVGNNVKL